jgi:hypothetical protein
LLTFSLSGVVYLLLHQTPTLRCDARLALVLAGFVGHRLRHTHAGIYRHRDPKLQKVIYLAVENETDEMDCE